MSDKRVEHRKISELTPDINNANMGTERGLRALDDSLGEVGLGRSIVTDKHGTIIAGNKTVERAADRGFEDAIVVHTDGKQLVVVQRDDLDLADNDPNNNARKLAFYDNRVAELDLSWNPEQLQADKEAGVEVVDKLWSPVELDILGVGNGDTPEDSGAQVDRAAELQEKWQVQRGDVWTIGKHRIMCGDSTCAEDVEKLMGGVKASAVVTDPPYGMGLDEWDKPIDIAAFLKVTINVMANNSFLFFTIQMPMMLDWLNAIAATELKYKDHIVWVKRVMTAPLIDLPRSHESIFVYRKGKPKYYQTKGNYEDVKLPGVLFDVVSIQSIDRVIKDLFYKLEHGHTSGTEGNHLQHKSYSYIKGVADISRRTVNFTNVWSFLPEQQTARNTGIGSHATMKPIKMMARACELCAAPDGNIYDAFLGSGTTIVAAENTGRVGYGMELAPEYVAVCLERLADMGLTPERK